jgi:hypothetical protein
MSGAFLSQMLRKISVSTKLIFHITKAKDVDTYAVQLETKTSNLITLSLGQALNHSAEFC